MNGWESKKLSEICKVNYGQSPSLTLSEEGNILVIGTGNEIRYGENFLYDGESIILGRKGTIDNPIYVSGKFWAIDTAFYLSNFLDADVKWLYYYLLSRKSYFVSEATGVPSISRSFLYDLEINTPPKKEQTAIAQILSTVDKAIEQTEKLIAKYQRIKTGLMQDLLTKGIDEHGNIRSEKTHKFKNSPLGRIPFDWEVLSISEFAMITTGSKDTQDKIDSGEYPFYVRSQEIEKIDSYSYDGEAVLTSGDGVGVGKIYHYVNGKFDFHQRVYMIHQFKESVIAKFFYEYFKNNFYSEVSKYSAKTTVDSVRLNMISEMLIPIPIKKEQIIIVYTLENASKNIESGLKAFNKLSKLKSGLMQDLLTGKVLLPNRLINEIINSQSELRNGEK